MRCSATQAALLSSISAVRVFPMLEVEANLVKTLLRHEVFAFGSEVSTVYYGINKLIGVRTQITAGFDAANTLETKRVPDAARGDVGFVYKVEDRVCIALAMTSAEEGNFKEREDYQKQPRVLDKLPEDVLVL